jgi:hypothetical protein
METYVLVKLAHLLLFAYWLGGDIGVFHAATYLRKPQLTVQARETALRILVWIDMIPRYCLVLMLPVGYLLANSVGAVNLKPLWFVATGTVALAWLALVYAVHRYQGTPRGERLRRIDLIWRCVFVAGLLWDALQGFRGTGHLLTDWLSLKVLIYALCVVCGIGIRLRGKPLAPALRQLFASGSTPELEATIVRTQRRTRPFVLAIWALLIAAAYVGVAKPAFDY